MNTDRTARCPGLSVIIPTLNEAGTLGALLDELAPLRARGCELILVDGGSDDGTPELASGRVDRLLVTAPGRATQMNAGAAVARGWALWFLHADSTIPANADGIMRDALRMRAWGRFDVRLSGRRPMLRMVEVAINLRSRLTGIATGDQGIFVRRETFAVVGGFSPLPLMEDIDLSRRLRHVAGRPACLSRQLVTSSRRWEDRGVVRTIALMWWLRSAYALGVNPGRLAQWYR